MMTGDDQGRSNKPTLRVVKAEPDTTPEPKPGVVLEDRYELLEAIGGGGMGQVFRAHDDWLRREVAIKVLRAEMAVDPSMRNMFLREAAVMANLRHPNVVAVHDTGGWNGQPFLVMPFHRAADLERWVVERNGPPLTPDVAMTILGQACAGLGAMHLAGVIHGDIKPRNMLVSDTLEVTLVDLGLSRTTAMTEEPEALTGTPGYLAPEFIRRETVEPELLPKSDIYSLGVTAYWLLTGYLPWDAGQPMEILSAQLDGSFTPASERRPGLSPAFDEPLARAMHLDPRQRPDAHEFRAQLQAASRGRSHNRAPLVVIIDDDADMLQLEMEIVRASVEGAEVVGVPDAHAALALIEQRPPDLVITDLQMPRLNGIELTAMLRGKPATASIPIIAVTGQGGAGEWRLLHMLGAECLLVKPMQPAMLRDAVRRVLEPEDD